jgi:hypothetical protein
MITSFSVLLAMSNVSDKSCGENQNTLFMLKNVSSENRAVYEIMWESVVQPDRPHVTI